MRGSGTGRWFGAAAFAAALLLSACASDDGATGVSTPTSSFDGQAPATEAGQTDTTTGDDEAGDDEAVDDAVSAEEFYRSVGFDDDEIACLVATPVDDDVIAEPIIADEMPVALHYEGAAAPVIVRPGALSLVEVEREVLENFAADCADAAKLDALAVELAAAVDATFDDTLAAHLNARTSDGATPTEVGCLDAAFRNAPARLVGIAATPTVTEADCASLERRAAWRNAALQRGFAALGVPANIAACLSVDDEVMNRLEAAAYGVSSEAPLPACTPAEVWDELVETLSAKEAPFGVEAIGVPENIPL